MGFETVSSYCTSGNGFLRSWVDSDGVCDPLAARGLDLAVVGQHVVDLMRLEPDTEHPHGLPDSEFDALFTASRPVIFAYHGYPSLIHRLTHRRANHHNLHVRGYPGSRASASGTEASVRRSIRASRGVRRACQKPSATSTSITAARMKEAIAPQNMTSPIVENA